MRKLVKRQENDQTQIPNQSGYEAIHFHRLDGNKNRLSAKGKSRKKTDEQRIPDLSVACRQDLGVRIFDILSDSREGRGRLRRRMNPVKYCFAGTRPSRDAGFLEFSLSAFEIRHF